MWFVPAGSELFDTLEQLPGGALCRHIQQKPDSSIPLIGFLGFADHNEEKLSRLSKIPAFSVQPAGHLDSGQAFGRGQICGEVQQGFGTRPISRYCKIDGSQLPEHDLHIRAFRLEGYQRLLDRLYGQSILPPVQQILSLKKQRYLRIEAVKLIPLLQVRIGPGVKSGCRLVEKQIDEQLPPARLFQPMSRHGAEQIQLIVPGRLPSFSLLQEGQHRLVLFLPVASLQQVSTCPVFDPGPPPATRQLSCQGFGLFKAVGVQVSSDQDKRRLLPPGRIPSPPLKVEQLLSGLRESRAVRRFAVRLMGVASVHSLHRRSLGQRKENLGKVEGRPRAKAKCFGQVASLYSQLL